MGTSPGTQGLVGAGPMAKPQSRRQGSEQPTQHVLVKHGAGEGDLGAGPWPHSGSWVGLVVGDSVLLCRDAGG